MKTTSRNQSGAVLFALLLGLLGFAGYMAYAQGSAKHARLESTRAQQAAMAVAREALIARAANDANRPGSLPCPAQLKPAASDGRADLLAGQHCPSLIGRLPWSTLDIPQPVDANLNTLWYVIAPGLRDHQSASPINSDTATGLSLNGKDNIAALIIRPGTPLPGQKRPSNDPADYLEVSLSQNNPRDFKTAPESNDSILGITRSSLMAAVELRIAHKLRDCLSAYARQTGRYPWPAPLSSNFGEGRSGSRFGRVPLSQPADDGEGKNQPMAWTSASCNFLAEQNSWWYEGKWSDSIFYQFGDALKPEQASLQIPGQPARPLAVIAGGARINGQQRPGKDVADYLEGRNAAPSRNGDAEIPDNTFDAPQRRPNHNDQIVH